MLWIRLAELTNDPCCPYCGVRTPNACKQHNWAYRFWVQRLWEGVKDEGGTASDVRSAG